MLEKASIFDRVKVTRTEVDRALALLKEFRQKYPFTENLRAIEYLDPDKLFKVNPDEVGEFFHLLEGSLKPLGRQVLTAPTFTATLAYKSGNSKTCFASQWTAESPSPKKSMLHGKK